MKYEKHEFNFFPTNDADYQAIVGNMRDYGYDKDQSVVLFEGKILDGWHRYRAALEVGLTPSFRTFSGSEQEAFDASIRWNKDRRHLTSSQWAAVGVDAEKVMDALNERVEAEQRKKLSEAKIGNENATKQHCQLIDSVVFDDAQVEPKKEPDFKAWNESRATHKAAQIFNTNRDYISKAKKIKEESPEHYEKIKSGEMTIPKAIQDIKKENTINRLKKIEEMPVQEISQLYDVIVIDPPWPMKKIERDCAPNQVEFEYPTMNEKELEELGIPHANDCHIWLWTTHKFMPMAFRLINKWGMKYVCVFTWHKPGGFQPFNLPQYNCEFAIYCRIGSPIFTETKAFNVCFDAPRGKHSEKPELFYEMIRRVTSGKRLDMFNRRAIEGFETWGKESIK